MGFFSIDINNDGLKKAKKILSARIRAVSDFTVPLNRVADDFYLTEEQWFSSKGGGRWKPLSKSYARWKNSAHPGKPIMRLHDRMWDEFTGQTRAGVLKISKNQLSITPNRSRDYWKKHQKGIDGVPQRTVLSPILQLRKKAWVAIVTRWLLGSEFEE